MQDFLADKHPESKLADSSTLVGSPPSVVIFLFNLVATAEYSICTEGCSL